MRPDDFRYFQVQANIDTAELGDPPEIPVLNLRCYLCGEFPVDEDGHSYTLTHLVQAALNHQKVCEA